MKHKTSILGLALALTLSSISAQAQLSHTYVSSKGDDASNCSLTTPCRYLQAALAATGAGGEITILDTADFNNGTTLTINKAISIANAGSADAQITFPPGYGVAILIDAGMADDITLRGLSVDGGGIQFRGGRSLTVENCVLRHRYGENILFWPRNGPATLTVSNTVVAESGNGINVFPEGGGTVTALFNRVEAVNNTNYGILVDGEAFGGRIAATVSDSSAVGNGGAGLAVSTLKDHAPTTLMVTRSVAANNNIGLFSWGDGAILRFGNSTVSGNLNGWSGFRNGLILTYGDNYIDGNFGPNVGTWAVVPKQ